MIPLLVLLVGCPSADTEPDDSGTTGTTGTGDGGTDSCTIADIDPDSLLEGNAPCREPVLATVVYHADGDTFVVETDQGDETVRFIGVDTPETGYNDTEKECYATEASAFTAENFPLGSCVWLTFDAECTDYYDRTLAYLHTGTGEQDFFQRRMLRGGYAETLVVDPNNTFESTFAADEAAAKADGAGQWSACD